MNLNPFLKWYGTTFGKRVWKIIFAVKMTIKSDYIVLLNPFDFRGGARNLDCGSGLCLVTREITRIVRYHSTANPNLWELETWKHRDTWNMTRYRCDIWAMRPCDSTLVALGRFPSLRHFQTWHGQLHKAEPPTIWRSRLPTLYPHWWEIIAKIQGFPLPGCEIDPNEPGLWDIDDPHVVTIILVWLVVLTILKNISQWEGLSHITYYGKKTCSKPPTRK